MSDDELRKLPPTPLPAVQLSRPSPRLRGKKMSQPNPPTSPAQRPAYWVSPSAMKRTSIPLLNVHRPGDDEDEDEEDATQRLETAVRKISRGSPNLQRSPGGGTVSASVVASTAAVSEPIRLEGLSGLARGYEQYRESLTYYRPTSAEFGEASSDDLSSEWESGASDVEQNNNNLPARPMTPMNHLLHEISSATEEARKRAAAAAAAVETANNQLARIKLEQEARNRKAEDGEKESEAETRARGNDSPPPRKLVLPPPSAQRADQPKRVGIKTRYREMGPSKRLCFN